jgi:hypothetical protein
MKFRNVPGKLVDSSEKFVKPEEKEKRKYSHHFKSEKKNVIDVIKNIIFFVTIVAVIVFLISFVPNTIRTIKKINSVRAEINFAIDHPELVKPIRDLYVMSHEKTDADLIKVLEVK